MTVSPTFGRWPVAGALLGPTVTSDGDVPTPSVGVSCFYNSIDAMWRLRLSDGSIIDIGPFTPTPDTALTARAIASVDGDSLTPTILFQLGNSQGHPGQNFFTGVTRVSPGVFDLATTAAVEYNDAVIVVTPRATVVGGHPIIADYSLSNSPDVFVQLWRLDETPTDSSFSIVVYTTAG